MTIEIQKWDYRALSLAKFTANWSKDPSTKVGAVVMRPDKTVASVGFNGFPRNVSDDTRLNNRDEKYELIIHAEMNAILTAAEPVRGYTLAVWPMFPCTRCAVHIVQAGIAHVIGPSISKTNERWIGSIEKSTAIFKEAGVRVTEIDI
jgi:dCMP deaminase